MKINEKKVMIKGNFNIATTVTYEDENKKYPAVVLIMGTGKLDRDGNGFGFKSNLYKDLAESFAGCGFVTARYDKRGTHHSGGSFKKAGLSDLVNDAISVVRYLKKQPYVDEKRIIVCGHSEGSMIATLLAEKEDVAGLILLGGAGMNMKDALYYQNRLVAEDIPNLKGLTAALMKKTFDIDKQLAAVDELFEKSAKTDKDTVFMKGASMPAKWIREHSAYTSAGFAKKVIDFGRPVLAVTGKADVQADYRFLEAFEGAENVECHTPEKLNHILRDNYGDNSVLNIKKQYRRLIGEPISSELLTIMREWLQNFSE